MNAPAEPDRIIGTMAKNSREGIAVMLRTFKGHRFCDVRVMVAGPDGSATPTGKGVALKTSAIPELISLLKNAHKAAVVAGWCDSDGA